MQVAHLKLCASRAFWLVAYPTQGHEMLFDAHTRSFAALGGIPQRGIYDNMKTAVDKVKKGKGRVVNARFAAMSAHYLFDPDFCNVASGWEKGRVEKNVQDSRRRVWIDASRQRFGSFEELNVWLGQRCRELWAEIHHPEHSQFTVAEMLEHELPHLMPMPEPFDGYVENPARVSSTCLVMVLRNRYSVPCELAGQMVSTRLYPTRVVVVAEDRIVANHARLGDRVMAQVLAAVPTAGLDGVLVAVELVLESGAVSAEHVLNVLARLNTALPPQAVETVLTVSEAPTADTGRYDSLRGSEQDAAQEVGHA
jgi:hypothetical protein